MKCKIVDLEKKLSAYVQTTLRYEDVIGSDVNTSASFLAELSVSSPRKLFIFII